MESTGQMQDFPIGISSKNRRQNANRSQKNTNFVNGQQKKCEFRVRIANIIRDLQKKCKYLQGIGKKGNIVKELQKNTNIVKQSRNER